MVNLIFDGNWLFHKSLAVFLYNAEKNCEFESLEEHSMFMKKVSSDFINIMKKFQPFVKKIVFTVDSHSWRKEMVNNDETREFEYKSNRFKDTTIFNWDNFYKLCNEFTNILKDNGVIVSRLNSAEGDDLIYLWSKEFLEKKENSIIISTDKDLQQLVSVKDDNFIIIHNLKEFIVSEGFSNMFDNIKLQNNFSEKDNIYELFNLTESMLSDENVYDNFYEKIIKENIVNQIIPQKNILSKILIGDKSDAIPPAYFYRANVNKMYVSGKKFENLYNKLVYNDKYIFSLKELYYNEEYRLYVSGLIIGMFNDRYTKPIDVSNNIKNNIKYVLLKDYIIPENIIKGFETHKEDVMNNQNNVSESIIKQNVKGLLENTDYYTNSDDENNFITVSIFSKDSMFKI